MSDSEVRRKVLGRRIQYLEQVLNVNKLGWLGNILRISIERLPRCALFFKVGGDRMMVRGGPSME